MVSSVTAIFSFVLLVCASALSTDTSAVFAFNASSDDQFVFALNAVDNGDVFFHMSAPAGNSWMAVGIGSQMAGSLMFIAYPSGNSTGITLSPRIASHGNSEPTYASGIRCEKIFDANLTYANTVTTAGQGGLQGNMYADAVCRNVTAWSGLTTGLNLTSKAQEFIFAVGPGEPINSDSTAAALSRHAYHGRFTMDMTAATSNSTGSVPRPNSPWNGYTTRNASSVLDGKKDNNGAQIAHAFVMCLTFIVVFPFGSLVVRISKIVALHAITQTFGLLLVIIGFGTGCYMSTLYNRSRSFHSGHQVLGLILLMTALFQFGVGLFSHKRFKKGAPVPVLNKIHLYIGPLVIIVGLVNGGLGFRLAGNGYLNQYYIVSIIIVALVYFAIRGLIACSHSRRQRKKLAQEEQELPPYPQQPAYQQGSYAQLHDPPAYGQVFPGAGHRGNVNQQSTFDAPPVQPQAAYMRPS